MRRVRLVRRVRVVRRARLVRQVRLVLVLACLVLGAASPSRADTRVRVEFTDRGECSVTANGPASRSHVRYPRVTPEWRCAVPGLRDAGSVDLEVLAPPGADRPAASFPRLRWEPHGDRWVGRARLPSAPAFVRLAPAGSRGSRWLDLSVVLAAAAAIVWSLAIGRGGGPGSTSLQARPN